MNKKFISISLSIFILSLIFILGFKVILGNKVLYNDSTDFEQDRPTIKYVGFEEEESFYKIKVRIKNNTDYVASFYDISLNFSGRAQGIPTFAGYDLNQREYFNNYKEGMEEYSSFFDPKEERIYVFEVSKGIKFDKEVFDTNRMAIEYNVRYFKRRMNKNTAIGNAFSSSSVEFIDNSRDPYILE